MKIIEENKYTIEMVAQILKGYIDLKRKALQLEFEIKNYVPVATGEDVINTMTFGKPEDYGVSFLRKGSVSDKTADIAVKYSEKTKMLETVHIKMASKSIAKIIMPV